MTFKELVRAAKNTLKSEKHPWTPPPRSALSVEPLLAASCLRLGLRYGHARLALSAAATLVIFDPERLWRELLIAAAIEVGPVDLTPALAVLAAKKDPAWRRTIGGDWHVASLLIDRLANHNKSNAALVLWRMSFSKAENPDPAIRRMTMDARAIRLGLVMTPEKTPETYGAAMKVLERLAEGRGGWGLIEASQALWRQTGEGAVLTLPLLACQPPRLISEVEANRILVQEAVLHLETALTQRTAAGRAAIRELIHTDPDLLAEWRRLALSESDMIEAVGDLIEWLDTEAARPRWFGCGRFGEGFSWCGVPHLPEQDAQPLGEIIRTKAPLLADVRGHYLPAPLREFGV